VIDFYYFPILFLLKVSDMDKRITNQEILEAIHTFSSYVDKEFSNIKSIMVTKDELKDAFKNEFAKFETRMVSKDYLDQKLSDLHGELIEPVRRGEKRLVATLDLLTTKNLVTEKEAVEVLG